MSSFITTLVSKEMNFYKKKCPKSRHTDEQYFSYKMELFDY